MPLVRLHVAVPHIPVPVPVCSVGGARGRVGGWRRVGHRARSDRKRRRADGRLLHARRLARQVHAAGMQGARSKHMDPAGWLLKLPGGAHLRSHRRYLCRHAQLLQSCMPLPAAAGLQVLPCCLACCTLPTRVGEGMGKGWSATVRVAGVSSGGGSLTCCCSLWAPSQVLWRLASSRHATQ